MANELRHKTIGTALTQAEYEAIDGHELESQATGDIIYASSATQLSRLAIVAGRLLGVVGGIPSWLAFGTGAGAPAEGNHTTPVMTATVAGHVPTPPNNTTTFLRGDGTFAAPGGSANITFATIFETSGRFTLTVSGAGTNTFGTTGFVLGNGSGVDAAAKCRAILGAGTVQALFAGSPVFSCMFSINNTDERNRAFFGIGNVTVVGGAGGHTFTNAHIGFKLFSDGVTLSLHGTQADGTTENATAALRTIVANDTYDVICVVNSTTSVDYYTRSNGGALSSASNLTTNLPTAAESSLQVSMSCVTNAAITTTVSSISYER